MAPAATGSVGSGTIRSSSNSRIVPRPLQAVQAPEGLLKEKRRGESSSRELSGWSGQAYLAE